MRYRVYVYTRGGSSPGPTPPALNCSGLLSTRLYLPRASIYTTIMELGAKNHIEDGLLGPNSIMVVYVDRRG